MPSHAYRLLTILLLATSAAVGCARAPLSDLARARRAGPVDGPAPSAAPGTAPEEVKVDPDDEERLGDQGEGLPGYLVSPEKIVFTRGEPARIVGAPGAVNAAPGTAPPVEGHVWAVRDADADAAPSTVPTSLAARELGKVALLPDGSFHVELAVSGSVAPTHELIALTFGKMESADRIELRRASDVERVAVKSPASDGAFVALGRSAPSGSVVVELKGVGGGAGCPAGFTRFGQVGICSGGGCGLAADLCAARADLATLAPDARVVERLYVTPSQGGPTVACQAGFEPVLSFNDCGGGTCTTSLQFFCALYARKDDAVAAGRGFVADVQVSALGQRLDASATCPAGKVLIGGIADCFGTTCAGNQIACAEMRARP